MTNGQPDSILELSDAEQDTIRDERWHAEHPECCECGERMCIAGRSCGCGCNEGGRGPGEEKAEHPEYVCHGICQAVYVDEEMLFELRERFERLEAKFGEPSRKQLEDAVAKVKAVLLAVPPQLGSVADYRAWVDERSRNAIAALSGCSL